MAILQLDDSPAGRWYRNVGGSNPSIATKTNKMEEEVIVVKNDDYTYSIAPDFQWGWERADWINSEEARQGIFAEEFSTRKSAIRNAQDMGHVVNVN